MAATTDKEAQSLLDELRKQLAEAKAEREEVKAERARLKAQQEEAERLINQAREQATNTSAGNRRKTPTCNAPHPKEYYEERVPLYLFKDSGRYKDDVTAVVNGKVYQIKRGVRVEVPRKVAEVLEHSMEQDARTAERMDMLEEEYRRNSDHYGV